MKKLFNFLTLFTSLSTLFCCALPALFIALGAGGALISVTTNIPGFIWLSKHKIALFIVAGVFIVIGGVLRYRARNTACPIDKDQREACDSSRKISEMTYVVSVILYLVGGFFAFVAPYLI